MKFTAISCEATGTQESSLCPPGTKLIAKEIEIADTPSVISTANSGYLTSFGFGAIILFYSLGLAGKFIKRGTKL